MHTPSVEHNSGYNNSAYESKPNSGYNNSAYESKPNSGYNNSGYESEPDLTVGYSSSREVRQGNFDDAYQENVYDLSNLADTRWTDSAVRPNPQLELELD